MQSEIWLCWNSPSWYSFSIHLTYHLLPYSPTPAVADFIPKRLQMAVKLKQKCMRISHTLLPYPYCYLTHCQKKSLLPLPFESNGGLCLLDKHKMAEVIAFSCLSLDVPAMTWKTQTGSSRKTTRRIPYPGSCVPSSGPVLRTERVQEWIPDDFIPLPSRLPFEITHAVSQRQSLFVVVLLFCFPDTGSPYVAQAGF